MNFTRALLLDLDDTLLDDRGAMADAVLEFRQKFQLCVGEDDNIVSGRWDTVGRELWRKMSYGEVSFEDHRRLRIKWSFNLDISDQEADQLFESYLDCYECNWRLLPGAAFFLEQTSHLLRVAVTNGHKSQVYQKLERVGLESVFNGVVTPEDCGARKPDIKIFQHALNLIGVKAEEAMMIGDNEEIDIAPAAGIGMKTFHINQPGKGSKFEDVLIAI